MAEGGNRKRGVAMIIVNTFSNTRRGAENDFNNLKTTFEAMHFDTREYLDKTRGEILEGAQTGE